jgi:hypothetical protein
MKHTARALAVITIVATAILIPPSVTALTGDALSLEVLVNGRPLDEIAARGTTYIEAVRHAEYSLRLTNRTGRRLAVALAVDGLNTIDAKSGDAATASKWVLEPWQTVTIEGWQVDPNAARRFFFTSEAKSYSAWLGETANLGVIEAVAYRELVPEPPPYPVQQRQKDESFGSRSQESAEPQSAGKAAPSPVDDLAATGIGRRVDHRVTRVDLRLEPSPAAQLRLRYEYRQQLVELGVLPSPEEEQALARRERARGFDGFEFAPDPWGGGR